MYLLYHHDFDDSLPWGKKSTAAELQMWQYTYVHQGFKINGKVTCNSTVHQNDDIGNKIFIGSRGISYADDTQLYRVGVRHVQSGSGRECQQPNLCSSTVIAD